MNRIKTFLSLIIFAISAAFNFTFAQSPPKTTLIKLKTEKVERSAAPAKAVVTNFHSTDCLVLYESGQTDFFASRQSRIIVSETFYMVSLADSKFFRTKPELRRRLKFSSV